VPELQPLALPASGGHAGEILALAYTPDSAYVLSGGWDGHLRLWDAVAGTPTGGFRAGAKPVSACAVAPDGKHAASGNMDGFLGYWDLLGQRQTLSFVAHARPVSGLAFAGDGHLLATASWDRNLGLWDLDQHTRTRMLAGHTDIVAGCRFTPDGTTLLSWSHDGSLRLWDVARERLLGKLAGHADRVTAGAISPDGHWAASGSRDGTVKLWDLATRQEAGAVQLETEVRACLFLRDGVSLIAADGQGRLRLYALPELAVRGELATGQRMQCAELAPSGGQIALGCENGRVQFVTVAGFDEAPLLAPAARGTRYTATRLQRLLGRQRLIHIYCCTCPVCQQTFELGREEAGRLQVCPGCRRKLRISTPAYAEAQTAR
jgi:WD40 repeat protein